MDPQTTHSPHDPPVASALPRAEPADNGPADTPEPSSPTRPAAAPRLHTIRIFVPRLLLPLWVVVSWIATIAFYGALIFLVMRPIAIRFGITPNPAVVVFGGIVLIVIGTAIPAALFKWRARRKAKKILLAEFSVLSPAGVFDTVWRRRTPFTGTTGVEHVASVLAATGHTGFIVRLCDARHDQPVTPLNVVFEPRPLNETDPSFAELREAVIEQSPSSLRAVIRDALPQTTRAIWRNIHLKGGKLSTLITVFFFANNAYRCIMTKSVNFGVVFWGLALAFLLFRPASGAGLGILHLLPAAIFGRSNEGQVVVSPRLFRRADCNLVVREVTQHKWMVLVTEGEFRHRCVATPAEVDMLLRCWMSEAEPPDEQWVARMVGAPVGAPATPSPPLAVDAGTPEDRSA